MAIDGILIRSITKELSDNLIGGRIQKIYQINDHLIILNIYNKKNNYRLLISSNPQNSRIHFTDQEYDNPAKAPQFSMILRKHLQNSIIREINQIYLDRSIEIIVETKDELGLNCTKKLFIDVMGKYSNIVLLNEENKVIEAIKRISHEMSSVRAVYPGTKFNPLIDNKINVLDNNVDLNIFNDENNLNLKKFFYTYFTGFGPQISNEIIFRANLELNQKFNDLNLQQKEILNKVFNDFISKIKLFNFNYYNFVSSKNIIDDFYCFNLSYKGIDNIKFDSISKAMDMYYKNNVNDNSLNQAKYNLLKNLENLLIKNTNKLDNLNFDFENSKDYEKYRIEGDLLSSVAYKIEKGQTEIKVLNYFDNTDTLISLDPKKNVWENIEQKYKISKKLHKSNTLLKDSIPKLIENIEYIKSIINQIHIIDTHDELEEIKEELIKEEYIKKTGKSKKYINNEVSSPYKFFTQNNNIIYVGKNNKQNEYLTLREANPDDYFFHIKDLPGAHVILKNNQKIEEEDIYAAAYLAAKYSKNGNDRYIDVDYTQKKNVNKAKGSKLGMVYYTNYNTYRIDLENIPKNINL